MASAKAATRPSETRTVETRMSYEQEQLTKSFKSGELFRSRGADVVKKGKSKEADAALSHRVQPDPSAPQVS